MQAVDNLLFACVAEIFPSGQTQRDCLFGKGQRLLSGLVVHLVCGYTVNQNMQRIVTGSATRVLSLHIDSDLFLFWRASLLVGVHKQNNDNRIVQVIMLR